jgi:hypothetical protein
VRRYWIFNIGTAAFAPQEDWLADWRHHTAEMWFPPNKRPSGVRAGDRAVIHGTGGRGFFAVVEVISSAPEASTADKLEDRERWPFRLRYKLLLAIRADDHAPSLEHVGWENPKRLRRQPHVLIDEQLYERIAQAIVRGAREAVAV